MSRDHVRPELVIVVPLEGAPRVHVFAGVEDDEIRLRLWLRRAAAVDAIPAAVEAALDLIDERRAA